MQVYESSITLEFSCLKGSNPLPMFRNREHHRTVPDNGTFREEHRVKLGYEVGERILPYSMQDRYSRKRQLQELKTIVLENQNLKALFLPEYGGRLYSLLDKTSNQELLYKNPVFQPGNLAILNAWFSGGIEWNIGQVGHTFTTCSPVHAAKLDDGEGNEFLRIYEYERCKNVFWKIDFHLPQDSEQLLIYVRMNNDNKEAVPMYWWTNMAVQETPEARIFSSTDNVIYIDHTIKGFGLGQLPELPSVPNEDASYPMRIPFSNEYFFQTEEDKMSPWEAVAYEDGRLLYERSTSLLRYRKMFCWGNHSGGRRWCDFLANPGEGDYIEIQSGLAPTQLHGLDMPANTVWDFTQIIGLSSIECDKAYQESWQDSCAHVEAHIDQLLTEEEVDEAHLKLSALASKPPKEILHEGSGWGALERIRRETKEGRSIPEGLLFADSSLSAPQESWLHLLREGYLPNMRPEDVPLSWMVQEEWLMLLHRSMLAADHQSWYSLLHYGVMLYEKGDEERAVEAWKQSLDLTPSAWVYRNLAIVSIHRGEKMEALSYMEKAYGLSEMFPDQAFAEEYFHLLIQSEDYEKAWRVYESLSHEFDQSERLKIMAGAAALVLNKSVFLESLFQSEFAVIREGETTIVELWYQYQAQKMANERNTMLTEEILNEAKRSFPPPYNIDFRIIGS